MVAVILLYRGLAIGTMAVVAPISATGMLLPVIVGLATGDYPAYLQKLGMTIAITGTILVSGEKGADGKSNPLASGVGLTIGSAIAADVLTLYFKNLGNWILDIFSIDRYSCGRSRMA